MSKHISQYFSAMALSFLVTLATTSNVFAELININKADAITLTQLKGIGTVRAKAIVAYRVENGRFQSIQELTAVKGIGEKTFNDLRDDASINKGMSKLPKKHGKKSVS